MSNRNNKPPRRKKKDAAAAANKQHQTMKLKFDDEEFKFKLHESLVWNILQTESAKNSMIYHDEAEGNIEAVIDSIIDSSNNHDNSAVTGSCLIEFLMDYFPDVSKRECSDVADKAVKYTFGDIDDFRADNIINIVNDLDDDDCDHDNHSDNTKDTHDNDSNDDDNGSVGSYDNDYEVEYIQEGECELCFRDVKLSRHHMIPRSTWPKIRPRFIQAAPYFIDGNMNMVKQILNFEQIPSTLSKDDFSSPSKIKYFLSCYTCNICRLCHSAVHRVFDNIELAEKRNSIDLLLENEQILKFCKWASKQKPRRR